MMLRVKKVIFFIFIVFAHINLYAKEEVVQLQTGNFALPNSQQPGQLVGFGQNVIDKGDLLGFTVLQQNKGRNSNSIEALPSALYGISDHASLLVSVPLEFYNKQNNQRTSGISSVSAQFEVSLYKKKERTFSDEITVLGNVAFPMNKENKNPLFFLGTTWSRLHVDWYFYGSPIFLFSSAHGDNRPGNHYLIQGGIGRNIPTSSRYIVMGQIEFTGMFMERDTKQGKLDQDSGGYLISLAPSLWFSSHRWFAQAGVVLPVSQYLPEQGKNYYFLAAVAGYKF